MFRASGGAPPRLACQMTFKPLYMSPIPSYKQSEHEQAVVCAVLERCVIHRAPNLSHRNSAPRKSLFSITCLAHSHDKYMAANLLEDGTAPGYALMKHFKSTAHE